MDMSNGPEMLIRSLSGLICSHSAVIKSSKKKSCQHSQAHRRLSRMRHSQHKGVKGNRFISHFPIP